MKKRGLSAVITAIIFIVLVLVAIGILWGVVKKFISEESEKVSLGQLTTDLKIIEKSIQLSPTDESISFKIKRKTGEGDLKGIKVILSDGENTYSETVDALEQLEEKTFTIDYSESDLVFVKDISIAPVFETASGKEQVGDVVDEYEFVMFRDDDNEKNIGYGGDAGDDGVNKWLIIDKGKLKRDNAILLIYGKATKCDEQATDSYYIRVNDDNSKVINFNWCEMFGLNQEGDFQSSDYEWKEFSIPVDWLKDGENKFNFWDNGEWPCRYYCANWVIGFDTNNDYDRSAHCSNCGDGTDPPRENFDGSEAMIFLIG